MAFPFGVIPPCGHKGLDIYGNPSHDTTAVHFDSFNCYALSFEQAARALAAYPESNGNPELQYEICKEYGVFLDELTSSEINHLTSLVEELINE